MTHRHSLFLNDKELVVGRHRRQRQLWIEHEHEGPHMGFILFALDGDRRDYYQVIGEDHIKRGTFWYEAGAVNRPK